MGMVMQMVYQFAKEWTEQSNKLPVISVSQPFALALVTGRKRMELRIWQTRYKGWLAIHAGKAWYQLKVGVVPELDDDTPLASMVKRLGTPTNEADYALGAVIGVARLVRCSRFSDMQRYEELYNLHKSEAEWNPKEYGWLFEDARMLADPIPWRGDLGLFAVDVTPELAALMK